MRTTLVVAADALHEVGGSAQDRTTFGLDLGIATGLGDETLRIAPLKVFCDGSMLGPEQIASLAGTPACPDGRRHTGAVPEEEIEFAHEVAATRATARRMATAMLGVTLRRARVRLCVVVLLVSASFFVLYRGDGLSLAARVFASIFWAAVLTLGVVVICSALGYVVNIRNLRRTVRPGTVQRTGFGRDAFVTANALSSSRFSYRAVQSVDSNRGFVFMRFVGQPVTRVYPQELFPPDAMTRLREATSRRGSGRPSA